VEQVQFGPARGEANGETGSFNSREREDKLRELAEELKVCLLGLYSLESRMF
jgi:hypothetical protein